MTREVIMNDEVFDSLFTSCEGSSEVMVKPITQVEVDVDLSKGWEIAVLRCIEICEARRKKFILDFDTPLRDVIEEMRKLLPGGL